MEENIAKAREAKKSEASDDESDEDADSDKSDADAKSSDDADEDKDEKPACYARVTSSSDWEEGGGHVYQYDISIINSSKEDISDWEVTVKGFKGGEIVNGWNGMYKIDGDVLSVIPMDYNNTVRAGATESAGIQIKFKDASGGSADDLTAELKVDGKVYTALKTSKPEKEKDEAKSEVKSDDDKAESKEKSEKENKKIGSKKKMVKETGTPFENHGKISIDGVNVVDKNGDPFQLKGVCTHGVGWYPEYLNEGAFKTFRDDWNANIIRLAVYTHEEAGYCTSGTKEQQKKDVKKAVNIATDLGMYVIIDWHVLRENSPLVYEDEATEFFKEMSAEFKDNENVIYEICNEPNGNVQWSEVKEYAERMIPVIRENAKDAIIIVGTPTWSQDVDIASEDPIEGYDNIAYALHFYAATHKENIRNKAKVARDKGLCVFVSEFSICDASGNGALDLESANEWFDFINENEMSYVAWNISNKEETSAFFKPECKKVDGGWSDDDMNESAIWIRDMLRGE